METTKRDQTITPDPLDPVEDAFFGDMDLELRCVRVALFKRMDRDQIERNHNRELQIRRFKVPWEILLTYGIKSVDAYSVSQMDYLEVFTKKHKPKDLNYTTHGKEAMLLHHVWEWNCFNDYDYELPVGGKKHRASADL